MKMELNQSREEPNDISLRDLVVPLFRKKLLLCFSFLAIFALAISVWGFFGPFYKSKMQILVNRERLDPLVSTADTTQMITNGTPLAPEDLRPACDIADAACRPT